MRKTIGIGLATLGILTSSVAAQDVKRPALLVPKVADSVMGFAPEGWRVEKERIQEADLNNDGRADAAFVLSNGGSSEDKPDEPAVVKHILVLAFRGGDGKLHRSTVNDSAVFDGDEGGSFGDPFDDLSIDHGVVVISHYGGSRQRWGFTHRYRFQNEHWTLVGLNIGYMDSTNLEHYDNQDVNLSTGLVAASEKGGNDGEPQKPEVSGAYYELEVSPADKAPLVDGRMSAGEWPGYVLQLNDKAQILRNGRSWRGITDLSAQVHAARVGDNLFLCVDVSDDEVTLGDTVRLVNKRGLPIKPRQTRKIPSARGYVFEARYSLKEIATAVRREDKYAVENLEMLLDPSSPYGDGQGFQLPASIEIIDFDNSAPRIGGVLSTRLAGSPYPGAIRIFRKGTLILESDVVN
jgi:hypothetical protein